MLVPEILPVKLIITRYNVAVCSLKRVSLFVRLGRGAEDSVEPSLMCCWNTPYADSFHFVAPKRIRLPPIRLSAHAGVTQYKGQNTVWQHRHHGNQLHPQSVILATATSDSVLTPGNGREIFAQDISTGTANTTVLSHGASSGAIITNNVQGVSPLTTGAPSNRVVSNIGLPSAVQIPSSTGVVSALSSVDGPVIVSSAMPSGPRQVEVLPVHRATGMHKRVRINPLTPSFR